MVRSTIPKIGKMRSPVDTAVREFSAGYAITEFNLELGNHQSVQISSYRAEDIREWWFEQGAGGPVPVVLRGDNRHLVPEEDDDLAYETLRIPTDMTDERGSASFLIPNEQHTRLLMGFDQ